MDRFTAFVIEHGNDDPAELVLGRERWPDIDVALAAATVAGRRKMRSKAPSWHACPDVVYPTGLSVEQCSSEAVCAIRARILGELFGSRHEAAGGKASGVVGGVFPEDEVAGGKASGGASLDPGAGLKASGTGVGLRIADLTGGLGIDSWAFSKFCSQVLYVERDRVLADAARHNFAALGCSNITVLNAEVTPQGLREVTEADTDNGRTVTDANAAAKSCSADGWEVVREFAPDLIYLDPARRASSGQKVFRLEDCTPDILQLRDALLSLAPKVMVKLSPMADIDMVLRQLGPCCRRADLISIDNECKELLVTMERDSRPESEMQKPDGETDTRDPRPEEECLIVADCGRADSFIFTRTEESTAIPILYNVADSLTGKILLEPDKALMKAAPFKLLSSRFGLTKLDVSTHYYIYDPRTDDNMPYGKSDPRTNERIPEGIFRKFKILRAEPLNNKTIKSVGKEYPNAEVTARNIPLTSDELRRRLNAARKSGHKSLETKFNLNANQPETGPATDKIHIFGLRAAGAPLLLVTSRLP